MISVYPAADRPAHGILEPQPRALDLADAVDDLLAHPEPEIERFGGQDAIFDPAFGFGLEARIGIDVEGREGEGLSAGIELERVCRSIEADSHVTVVRGIVDARYLHDRRRGHRRDDIVRDFRIPVVAGRTVAPGRANERVIDPRLTFGRQEVVLSDLPVEIDTEGGPAEVRLVADRELWKVVRVGAQIILEGEAQIGRLSLARRNLERLSIPVQLCPRIVRRRAARSRLLTGWATLEAISLFHPLLGLALVRGIGEPLAIRRREGLKENLLRAQRQFGTGRVIGICRHINVRKDVDLALRSRSSPAKQQCRRRNGGDRCQCLDTAEPVGHPQFCGHPLPPSRQALRARGRDSGLRERLEEAKECRHPNAVHRKRECGSRFNRYCANIPQKIIYCSNS